MAAQRPEYARWRRAIVWIMAFGVVELALFLVAYFSPAMRVLMRPLYIFVAIGFIVVLHTVTRPRQGDRRRSDRRDSVEL